MTAQIIQFIPKPNRAILDRIIGVPANVPGKNVVIGGGPIDIEIMAAEILKDEVFQPAEYKAPEKDGA